jgi:hypothetical protein
MRIELRQALAVHTGQPPSDRRIKGLAVQPRLPFFFQHLTIFAEGSLPDQQGVCHGNNGESEFIKVEQLLAIDELLLRRLNAAGVPE